MQGKRQFLCNQASDTIKMHDLIKCDKFFPVVFILEEW